MTRSLILALALPLACTPGEDDGLGGGGGATDGSGGDGADDGDGGSVALECALTPALTDAPRQVRVGPDGTVWLDQLGALHRYTRAEAEGCVLEGAAVWAGDDLDDVSSFALDEDGHPWVLSFFDELVQLDLDGEALRSCEVPAGHGVALTADASTAWVLGVGDESLQALDLDDGCAPLGDPLPLDVPVGPEVAWADGALAAAAHDSSGDHPAGYLLDPETGAVVGTLGDGLDTTDGDEPASIADLAWAGAAWWVAGSPGGDLWIYEADGQFRQHVTVHELLSQPESRTLGLSAIGRGIDQPSYFAAGFLDDQGLWANR